MMKGRRFYFNPGLGRKGLGSPGLAEFANNAMVKAEAGCPDFNEFLVGFVDDNFTDLFDKAFDAVSQTDISSG